MHNTRLIALNLIKRTLFEGGYSNIILRKALSDDLTSSEKRFISLLFYTAIERKITFDALISKHSKKPINKLDDDVLAILYLALAQIYFVDKVPVSAAVNEAVKQTVKLKKSSAKGFVNAVLRNCARDIPDLDLFFSSNYKGNELLSVKYSAPLPFVSKLTTDLGEENARCFLENSLNKADTYIRVNTTKTNEDNLLEILDKEGILAQKTDLANCLLLSGDLDFASLKSHSDGFYHIMDYSSQKALSLLDFKSTDRVLDLCAAPGGKSALAAQYLSDGEIISCDISKNKLKLVDELFLRLSLSNGKSIENDATLFNNSFDKFDKIICDLPCSGYGVIKKRPEIKYKDIKESKNLSKIQSDILDIAADYLKDGGELLYSTCTILKAENEEVVYKFLEKHSDFSLVEVDSVPQIKTIISEKSDGFFMAKLRKGENR